MKFKHYLSLLAFAPLALSAQQAELQFNTTVDCTTNEYCATIELNATQSNEFKVGTSSIFIDYNKDALEFKAYESLNFDANSKCIADEVSSYDNHQFDASMKGMLNTTITLNVMDFACPTVENETVDIAKICFDIKEMGASSGLSFRARHTNFNRGGASINLLEGITMKNQVEQIACKDDTGIEGFTENSYINSLEINPNPVKEDINLFIETEEADDLSVQIFDVQGRLVGQLNQPISVGNNQLRLDASQLASGVYLVDVNGKGFNTSIKLVKE